MTTLTVVRHGETTWSAAGRHTGRTDVPLTDTGRSMAATLAEKLAGRRFALVLTSPLDRARETARLAGHGDAEVDDDLVEWDYGDYDGRTTADIREERPGWSLWDDGAPGGETLADVAARADRVVKRVLAVDGDVLAFAHGHFLRVVACRWLGLAPDLGRHLVLDPATVSLLGWERETPALRSWNA